MTAELTKERLEKIRDRYRHRWAAQNGASWVMMGELLAAYDALASKLAAAGAET